MKETEWQAKVVSQIRKCNALVLNTHGHIYQQSGWPDIYIAHRFFSGWVELKGEHTLLEDHQRLIMKKLNERGVPAYVARYPNLIQNHEGRLLGKFDGSGKELLFKLVHILEVRNMVDAKE